MNRKHFKTFLVVAALLFFFASCKKENESEKDPNAFKKEWVTGKWKQKDLVISVDVKLGSTKIPAGTSMIALAPLLGQVFGKPLQQMIECTKDNQYEFDSQGNFTITGCIDLILPKAGNKGTWDMTVYDAVLELVSEEKVKDPHWINNINSTNMELALTVTIPGVGDAPMGLQLEKLP